MKSSHVVFSLLAITLLCLSFGFSGCGCSGTDTLAKPVESTANKTKTAVGKLEVQTRILAIKMAVDYYRGLNDKIPTTRELVAARFLDDAVARDPWGRDYRIELKDGIVVVSTLGADGKLGGIGDDADVSSQDFR